MHASCNDHIIPLSRGGMDHPMNMQPACSACNQLKGNRLMGELKKFKRLGQ